MIKVGEILHIPYLFHSCAVAVHAHSHTPALFLSGCVLLDAGRGDHALSSSGQSLWKCSQQVVLAYATGMG